MSKKTRSEIDQYSKLCGLDIGNCLDNIDAINSTLASQNCEIASKDTEVICNMMSKAVKLIKKKRIKEYETTN